MTTKTYVYKSKDEENFPESRISVTSLGAWVEATQTSLVEAEQAITIRLYMLYDVLRSRPEQNAAVNNFKEN